MSANLELKKQVVDEIVEKIKNSQSVILVDYKGLTVEEATILRNKCREANVEYKVYKNTLVRKAFNTLNVDLFDNDLNGPTATIFGADNIAAAKIMVKASKDLEGKIIVKSGYIDGAYNDAEAIKVVASLPSKEELIARMLGSLQSPLKKVMICLKQIGEKQGA